MQGKSRTGIYQCFHLLPVIKVIQARKVCFWALKANRCTQKKQEKSNQCCTSEGRGVSSHEVSACWRSCSTTHPAASIPQCETAWKGPAKPETIRDSQCWAQAGWRGPAAEQNCSGTEVLLEAAANASHVLARLSAAFGSVSAVAPALPGQHSPSSSAFSCYSLGARVSSSLR